MEQNKQLNKTNNFRILDALVMFCKILANFFFSDQNFSWTQSTRFAIVNLILSGVL